ncbi:hypothetical protein QFZ51_003347 [Chitinophaga sp. W3I9]|uniref:hypothetical protein n=1 Tax=unclassified Chitinophaga TaxID=2619133 RepID=UPI003D20915C
MIPPKEVAIDDSKAVPSPPKPPKIVQLTDLLKVVLWPTIALLIIIIYWRPLYLILDELPGVINNSESITIGSLSLKIEKSISRPPSKEIRDILSSMSASGVETLITGEGVTKYYHKSEALYGQEKYAELIKLGLYKEIDVNHLSLDPNNIKYQYGVQPTELGLQVRDYLMKVFAAILKEV